MFHSLRAVLSSPRPVRNSCCQAITQLSRSVCFCREMVSSSATRCASAASLSCPSRSTHAAAPASAITNNKASQATAEDALRGAAPCLLPAQPGRPCQPIYLLQIPRSPTPPQVAYYSLVPARSRVILQCRVAIPAGRGASPHPRHFQRSRSARIQPRAPCGQPAVTARSNLCVLT